MLKLKLILIKLLSRLNYRKIRQKAIIRIKDNGIGMSEAVQEKIFDDLFTTKE